MHFYFPLEVGYYIIAREWCMLAQSVRHGRRDIGDSSPMSPIHVVLYFILASHHVTDGATLGVGVASLDSIIHLHGSSTPPFRAAAFTVH